MGTKSPLSFLVATSTLEIHIVIMGGSMSRFPCGNLSITDQCDKATEACCRTGDKFECKKISDPSAKGCKTSKNKSRDLDADQLAGILDNVFFNSEWAKDE